MTVSQLDKALAFQALHRRSRAFVIANAWDAGSARVLQGLGFEAIATSSGAMANTLGRLDGDVAPEEVLAHVRAVSEAVDLPVAGDLERGFGDDPESVADTIRRAAAAGLVGGSIEDATGDPARPLYDAEHAAERVAAAAAAARALPFPFTLTARTENYLRGNPDLDDTIDRLRRFERAGADVLFAPGVADLATVREICRAVGKPVNFMISMPGASFSVAELEEAGVRRISVATALYRAAMAGMIAAATEVRERGTFTFVDALPSPKQYTAFMRRPGAKD